MIPTSSATATARDATSVQQAAVSTQATSKGKKHWASLFGSTLEKAKASLATSTSASAQTTQTDALGQISALLQSGMPMSTIIDQIAGSIGSSVASQLSNAYAQGDVDRLKSSITQSIANALAPPSNAPPGTAAQEAAALAARLRNVVTSLARDAQSETGQQNELSGNLLDADSAKETPAQTQQQSNGTTGTSLASQLVNSLLSSAAAALTAQASSSSTAAQSAGASTSMASILSGFASLTPGTANAASAVTTAAQQAAADGSATQNQAAGSPQPTSSLTMTNAPDLLARMIVRAAGADAQLNTSTLSADGSSSGSDAAQAASAAAGTTATPLALLTPAALAAKFAAMLAEATPSGIGSAGSSGNAGNGTGNSSHSFDQGSSQNAPPGAGATPTVAVLTPDSVQSNAQSQSSSSAQVDANKLIEQMISGMQMRTLAQGTSEIRLQLQPENLGQVSMRLTVSGNQVTANVVAQNADVGNALLANHRELARSLASSGLTLAGFSVDVSGGDAGNDHGKDKATGFGRRYVVHELNGKAATTETAQTPSTGPSLLPGSGLELFNSFA